MEKFDHAKIEKEAQELWASLNLYETDLTHTKKDPYYLLFEFPYPSGDLHIGHWYAFALTDIYARFKRMQGKNVLFPIGFDSFGLPAENAAIRNGVNPREWTYANMERMRTQIKSMGTSVDWSKEVVSSDPEYYRWTQWLFSKLYEHGLAERRLAPVKWCPKDQTVLANEQVSDGKCERCGTEVEEKNLTQWFLGITKYAKRLLEDLDPLPWREEIKDAQRAWIGESEGAKLTFPLKTTDIRFLLLHGRSGSPEDNFFPSLRHALEQAGYEVEAPTLPHADEPDDEEQAEFVANNCIIDENTVVIGHSFGGVVALRLAERGHRFAKTILVATPFTGSFLDGKERASVSKAVAKGYDFATIQKNSGAVHLLYDTHDKIVAVADGEAYLRSMPQVARFTGVQAESPHFLNSLEPSIAELCLPTIKVFTTRPDTIYGATYVVLAPEHPLVEALLPSLKNAEYVSAYVAEVQKKSERDRLENKVKTGVLLEGVSAINPATKEEIPVYIADYVLATYGTGAVMAVPAHDERDFEFAKKMQLPVRHVVLPVRIDETNPHVAGKEVVFRKIVMAIVRNPKNDTYLVLRVKNPTWTTFVIGGVEEGEDVETAARREVVEESGYKNLKYIRTLGGPVYSEFYAGHKGVNRTAHNTTVLFELENEEQDELDPEEAEKHSVDWVKFSDITRDKMSHAELDLVLERLRSGQDTYTGDGILANSDKFDGRNNREAMEDITASIGGEMVTNYRMRDWLVSRQRYWGCPIPVVYDPEGNAHLVPSEHLPWLLPEDVDFTPSGKSPLATSKELQERVVRIFGEGWTPEYDTLDTFVDSSWYFLRYLDSKDEHEFSDQAQMKRWLPVDRYSGGSEHTTMHLLYARFFHKALYDLALVPTPEPFNERFNRGIILGPDGAKMSKSKGNVVNPDEFVAKHGADAVRMYLAFIGPYNEPGSYPWNLDGVVSMRRFLDRIVLLSARLSNTEPDEALKKSMSVAIRKVGIDTERFKFNTAISALMVLVRDLDGYEHIPKAAYRELLILLAPFAPHLAEHLWKSAGGDGSVHQASFPEASVESASEVKVIVQINGKKRAELVVPASLSEEEVLKAAKSIPSVAVLLHEKSIVRAVYVPGRILNLVVDRS